MDFTITQDITKELLFQFLTEEQIFCNYLQLNQIPRKLILSPIREDRNPTCGFYRNSSGVLILHDLKDCSLFYHIAYKELCGQALIESA